VPVTSDLVYAIYPERGSYNASAGQTLLNQNICPSNTPVQEQSPVYNYETFVIVIIRNWTIYRQENTFHMIQRS